MDAGISIASPRAIHVDALAQVRVGPGCSRIDLPAFGEIRTWIVDMLPGAEWPHDDHHPQGEAYYVVSGEIIEGEIRHQAGTWVYFKPGSMHRPRTEAGVRLIGINPVAA